MNFHNRSSIHSLFFRGMKSVSAKSRMYITTYAKFISIMEHISKQFLKSDGNKDDTGDDDNKNAENEVERQVKVSSLASSKISNFMKAHSLQEKLGNK